MTRYFRIGGVALEPPLDFYERVQELLNIMPEKIDEYENLLTGNPIWVSRLKGVGYLSAEDAIALGVTGPPLRASRRRLGPAPRHALLRLREVPVQGARLERLRRLGALRRPHGGDARVGQDLPAGARRHARRPDQGRRAQDRPARPRKDEDADGSRSSITSRS